MGFFPDVAACVARLQSQCAGRGRLFITVLSSCLYCNLYELGGMTRPYRVRSCSARRRLAAEGKFRSFSAVISATAPSVASKFTLTSVLSRCESQAAASARPEANGAPYEHPPGTGGASAQISPAARSSRISLRKRLVREKSREFRPLLRHADVPDRTDLNRRAVDLGQRRRLDPVRRLSVHSAQSRLLDPGRLCRAVDPAGADPSGRPRQGYEPCRRPAPRRASSDQRAAPGADARTVWDADRNATAEHRADRARGSPAEAEHRTHRNDQDPCGKDRRGDHRGPHMRRAVRAQLNGLGRSETVYLSMNSIVCSSAAGETLNMPV